MTFYTGRFGRWLTVAFAAGVVVRVVVLTQTAALGPTIIDEQHYVQLADNLATGHGFGWAPGKLTSIRPPLYPALLAGVWTLVGDGSYQTVRVLQCVLSAATAWLVYLLGVSLVGRRAALVAAALVWLYPSLIFFNVTLLTETLYIFLLTAFIYVTSRLVQAPGPATAAAAGALLGLACLTRSALWPFPLVLCPLLIVLVRAPVRQRLSAAGLVFVGYAAIVAPWAARNTALQGVVTIVDTMGGLNLRMGNYEHTPEDRMWAAVELRGDRSWDVGLRADFGDRHPSEGEKDRWAQRKAFDYMLAHPGVTLRRTLVRFADFWGLEREYAAGISQGLYDPPAAFAVAGPVAIVLAYVALSLFGLAGIWLAPAADWRLNVVVLLPGLALMGTHLLVFAHSRYHMPLVPILALYAGALWSSWPERARRPRWTLAAARASAVVLVGIWLRQMLAGDAAHLRALFDHVG